MILFFSCQKTSASIFQPIWPCRIYINFFQHSWIANEYTNFWLFNLQKCGPGSVVGIATGYGLAVPGSNPGGGEIFRTSPDRPWGPPSLLYNGYRVFPGGKERPGRDADSSPLPVPCSRKSRAKPLLPLWAVRPVQSLSACTRVHFLIFRSISNWCHFLSYYYLLVRKQIGFVSSKLKNCNCVSWHALIILVASWVDQAVVRLLFITCGSWMEGTDNGLSTSSTVRRSESFRHFLFQGSVLSPLQACIIQSDVLLYSHTYFFPHPRRPHGATATSGPGRPHYRGFTITLTYTTLSRTAPDEWSAPHRKLYLTKHNTHKRQTAMLPAGFEPAIPANKRPHTLALDLLLTPTLYNQMTNFKETTHTPKSGRKNCVYSFDIKAIPLQAWRGP